MYKTVSHLHIDMCTDDREKDIDDFVSLHSLSLSNGAPTTRLPPSLCHLRLIAVDVIKDLFAYQLETLWIEDSEIHSEIHYTRPDSLPLKRLHMDNVSDLEDILSDILQQCSSTLEHIVWHNVDVSFPTSSIYPRLDTLSYYGTADTKKEERSTLYSLLRGSVLTHLCYQTPYLFPMETLILHATRLVYLELNWNNVDDDDDYSLVEERYIALFETLIHLKVLQHLVLYGPSSFTAEMLVKHLPPSPLVFPHLRSLTLSSDSVDHGLHFTAHRESPPVARFDLHSITLYYSPLRSGSFHMPRLSPVSSSPDTWWQYPFRTGTHLCPFEHTHYWQPTGLGIEWIRPQLVSWFPTTPELVNWCNQRDAVFMLRAPHIACPLVLLHGAVFSTTCPYDNCVCRLS